MIFKAVHGANSQVTEFLHRLYESAAQSAARPPGGVLW